MNVSCDFHQRKMRAVEISGTEESHVLYKWM